jgi:hypothetical protein
VAVKKMRMASGMTMIPMVRNWRFKKASAPSWMAVAISRILGVPVSWATTFRASRRPAKMPTMPATMATTSQTLSVVPRWYAWYPPSAARFMTPGIPGVPFLLLRRCRSHLARSLRTQEVGCRPACGANVAQGP